MGTDTAAAAAAARPGGEPEGGPADGMVDWRLLVQEGPNHLWRATPEGRLDFVNARMEEYLGQGAADLIAGGWEKAVHPSDLRHAVERWAQALAGGTPYEAEYRLRSAADGLFYWHRSRARPVRDPATGSVSCWVGTNVEINALRRTVEVADARQDMAQRERERLVRILQHAPAAMALYAGPDYRLAVANPAAEAIFGGRLVVGRTAREIFPELEGQGIFEILDRVYRTGEPFHAKAMRVLLDLDGDGTPEETYWDSVLQPLGAAGEPVHEVLSHAVEVTHLVAARG